MRNVLALMVAVVLSLPVVAQVIPRESPMFGSGSIVGRVVDSETRQPIRDATVILTAVGGPAGGIRMRTDGEGRFFVGHLRGRTWQISTNGSRRHVLLREGEHLTGLVLTAVQHGSISGRVMDHAGEPLPGRPVIALRRAMTFGVVSTAVQSRVVSDAVGEYEFPSLPPGDYLVCACHAEREPIDPALLKLLGLQTTTFGGRRPVTVDPHWPVFPPTFHPAALRSHDATVATVRSGASHQAIDVLMTAVPGTVVSGQVDNPGVALSSDGVVLRRTDLGDVLPAFAPMVVSPDGTFRFERIPPGDYRLHVRQTEGRTTRLSGEAMAWLDPPEWLRPPRPAPIATATWHADVPVTVNAEMPTLRVAVTRGAAIRGRVEWQGRTPGQDGESAARWGQIAIAALRQLTGGVTPATMVRPDDLGDFEVTGLPAGRYMIGWAGGRGLPRLQSVHGDGRDITDQAVAISDADVSEVVVRVTIDLLASVTGTFASTIGAQPPDWILAYPQDRRFWNDPSSAMRRFVFVPLDQHGRFTIDELPSGDYYLNGVDDAALNDFFQSGAVALQRLAATAEAVNLNSGDNAVALRRR